MAQGLIDAGLRKPDLLILDLGLPQMDGMSVLKRWRASGRMSLRISCARTG